MSYEDFWFNYDLRELWNAIEGFFNKQQREQQERWEQTRWIGTLIANKPVYGYKIKRTTPKELLPLPWDTEEIDKDEIEDVKQRLKALSNGK